MELRDKEIVQNEIIKGSGADDISAPDYKKSKRNPFRRMIDGGMFTVPFKIVLWSFAFSLFVYILSRFVQPFAEFWTKYPAQAIRFILAKLTGWFPFSLAECLLISIPLLTIGYIIASSVSAKRDESDRNFYRWLRPLVSVILVIATIFFSGFGPAYSRKKLADNLGIEQSSVSAEELLYTARVVSSEVDPILASVDFDVSGASIMPYSYSELVTRMNEAFDKYASSVDYLSHFKSTPKAIALSEPMTYTHISGVYTFMTGESNINTNYPDFLIPYTMAHEMAHQRGIAREDEANFVAFLVCIGSDDDYIRYSGYANMINYLNSALSRADSEDYKSFLNNELQNDIVAEFVAYSLFFDKYRESTASDIAGGVNDVFLQSQGQQAGTRSYGLVVDLAVAYYK